MDGYVDKEHSQTLFTVLVKSSRTKTTIVKGKIMLSA